MPVFLYGCCICLLSALVVPIFFDIRASVLDDANEAHYSAEAYPGQKFLSEEFHYDGGILNLHNAAREKKDIVLWAYRNPETKDIVVSFFTKLCGSLELAEIILFNASEYNIPPALAFSLCWEESQYFHRAVNRKNQNQTVDRGLFQLNSSSFPNLSEEDFYNPNTNARYGLSHLRWCLDHGGTEVAGLAMYNAGTGRVSTGGTPRSTLDYISRIINRQHKIDELFLINYNNLYKDLHVEIPEVISTNPAEAGKRIALSLLTPLGRK